MAEMLQRAGGQSVIALCQTDNRLCEKLGRDRLVHFNEAARRLSDQGEMGIRVPAKVGGHLGHAFQERALRVVSRFRHRSLLRLVAVLNAAGRVESPGSTLMLNHGESPCQMSGFPIPDTQEIRPATSSRPRRSVSPRVSSLRAGWRWLSDRYRQLDGRLDLEWSDLAGFLLLVALISPFIF